MTFNPDGSLRGEEQGRSLIGNLENTGNSDAVKDMVLKIVQGDLEETAGLRYDIPPERILLVDQVTYEKVARKSGSLYYREEDRFKNLRRPLTIYFSPFRSASTGKVKSKHILVIDADGKVAEDWSAPSGWVVGYTAKPLTNPNSLRLVKQFLSEHGIPVTKKDRAHRLKPQAMKTKLAQFQVQDIPD